MRVLLAVLLVASPAAAEVTASGAVRWAERGGVAPAFAVGLERPMGIVAPFVALELSQLERDAEAQGVPFSLVVREVALGLGVTLGRGRPFAQGGLRLALQALRSSTQAETRHDLGLGLGGQLAVGWRFPRGFTLALEAVLDPMGSELSGDTVVFSVGPRAGVRF